MKATEFISTLVRYAFDKNAIDFQIKEKKWDIMSFQLKEVEYNSFVVQWYATQLYLSVRFSTDRFSGDQMKSLARMYGETFMNYDFKQYNDTELKTKLLIKMPLHRVRYDALLTSKGTRDIMSQSFINDIGFCFAALCDRPDALSLKRLGSDLFRTCFNRCNREFVNSPIEF